MTGHRSTGANQRKDFEEARTSASGVRFRSALDVSHF